MPLLPWRPAGPRLSTPASTGRVPGAYAGRARFRPRDVRKVPDVLTLAIGRVIEFGFAGVAPAGQPFAGQALYLEWRRDDALKGFLIPEQDLEFVNESSDPRG
jgi:hypothetical protein